jgi:hypothetical protein
VRLTDLISRVLLLPLVTHLGLLPMLVNVLPVLRIMRLLRLRRIRRAHSVLGLVRMPRVIVARWFRARIYS